MPSQFVVMGVSGCGKSTLAKALAAQWGMYYIEGDDLHCADNVAKMASGISLNDDDRWPWLDRVGAALCLAFDGNRGAVASCSALRRSYRDRLRQAVGSQLRFVMIDLPRTVLEQRMRKRSGHYMPSSLLESQLRTLEMPVDEPDVFVINGGQPLQGMIDAASAWRVSRPTSGEIW